MAYKVAGIDVHKKVLMVVVREVGAPDLEPERRRFGTTSSELQRLSAWLRAQGVEEAVMESTAQYWKPVWFELAQVRHEKGPRSANWCGISLGCGRVCTTFLIKVEAVGNVDTEPVKKRPLLVSEGGNTPQADLAAVGCG
jgi:hypothetical protein